MLARIVGLIAIAVACGLLAGLALLADVPIPLERPRHVRSLQKDRHFLELYAHVWEELERGLGAAAEAVS